MTLDLFAPAVELAAAVRSKELSSLELTRAYIDRIEDVNPKLNAYVLTTPELALSQARTADDGHGGALKGVPVSIKDLSSVLGSKVTLLAPDGFTPISAVVDGAGKAAEGVYVSVAGQPNENLPAAGKTFVSDFGATQKGGQVDPYSSYAAQAAEVLLSAIEKSDGTRTSVTDNLIKTKVTNGILGNFTINSNGDTSSNPVTMYLIKGGKQTTYKTITPPQSLVKKA